MGVPGLWKLLSQTVQTRTLTQLSVAEGFEANRRGKGTISLGIDGSLLLNRAQWAAYHQTKRGISMQAGENLPLQILFWQVCRLLSLPIAPVVAFDGAERPMIKRGRPVKTAPHALMSAFMQLLKNAGFIAYVAPGEAEAELSQLNARGEIDAVLTDDVDAFLFGATHVIRTSNMVNDGDYISIFTAEAIKSTQLSRPRMLLIAILSGGDYAPGLDGCGIGIAHQLSIGTSLGEDLYVAARDLPRRELPDFLQGWRKRLRHQLAKDPDQILGRRYPAAARKVSRDFPRPDVLWYYLHPATSCSADIPSPQIHAASHADKQPDLAALAVWCEKYFSWGTNGQILERFRNNLWSGICIRSLMKPIDVDAAIATYIVQGISNVGNARPTIVRIARAALGPGPSKLRPNTWGYIVQVEPHSLVVTTLARLTSEIRKAAESQPRKTVMVWVPAPILGRAFPKLVECFRGAQHGAELFVQPAATPILSLVHHSSTTAGREPLGRITSSRIGSSSAFDPIVLDGESDASDEHMLGPPTR
ncbi:putative PIN domain-like protein [Lyophyllum shimeji]|uniref:PIN domain-like protein n=1 Tax=Lyophyllum shimeji TaxID=47721 RepID=A0A9P3PSK2_LYOSH|nr:putative PIN domain-like protein [Lyophyllum shimeji]